MRKLILILALVVPTVTGLSVLAEAKKDVPVAAAEVPPAVAKAEAPAAPAVAAAAAPTAAAPAAPVADPADLSSEEVAAIGKLVLEATRGGDWGLAVVAALMLLLWVTRKLILKERIPSSYMPWVAAGMGVVGALLANLQAGMSWGEAIMSGLTTGLAASGMYSLIGKKLLGATEKPAPKSEGGDAGAAEGSS